MMFVSSSHLQFTFICYETFKKIRYYNLQSVVLTFGTVCHHLYAPWPLILLFADR